VVRQVPDEAGDAGGRRIVGGKLLIYGATGYTGRLVASEAVEAGVWPVLAGRDAGKLGAMADSLRGAVRGRSRREAPEIRTFDLDEAAGITAALKDIDVVLHCAGPFSRTALPMFEACLEAGTHYADITGEIAVCEALAARDAEARDAGIMVLPAAGFDVVPSDCLIADLAARHPGGRVLRLGLSVRSGASRGTIKTALESVDAMRIRRDSEIRRVTAGSLRHDFDFGGGPTEALVTPLADVSTAWWSTGIENIETYNRAGRRLPRLMSLSRWLGWLLAGRAAQALLRGMVDRGPRGPSDAERRTSEGIMVAEIEDARGRRAAARMRVPDPYGFTAKAIVAIGVRALKGDFKAGYQTPSSAYGADFVRRFEGVEWEAL
jgi:short subunit dehydrogenase-like uncharacterized protein